LSPSFLRIQFSYQHPQASLESTTRGKNVSLYILGVKVGLMNYFSSFFECSGIVSIGRIKRKKIWDFFHFFVSQKSLQEVMSREKGIQVCKYAGIQDK
jgi:hypothetical protein